LTRPRKNGVDPHAFHESRTKIGIGPLGPQRKNDLSTPRQKCVSVLLISLKINKHTECLIRIAKIQNAAKKSTLLTVHHIQTGTA